MACAHCASKVHTKATSLAGVTKADVNLDAGVLIIEFDLFGDVGNYGNSYTEMWKETPIWATGIGFNVYVPFLEGFFVSIDLAWGPDNVSGKHGKPKFNFGVSKFY